MPEVRIATLFRVITKILGLAGIVLSLQLASSLASTSIGSASLYLALTIFFLASLLVASVLALMS